LSLEPSEKSSLETFQRSSSEASKRSPSQRLSQILAQRPSHKSKSKLYAPFKPPYKASNNQPAAPYTTKKKPSRLPRPSPTLLTQSSSLAQPRPPLNDLTN
ncbi:18843_t:CDS:1, partial [Dentiscutata erythropus]